MAAGVEDCLYVETSETPTRNELECVVWLFGEAYEPGGVQSEPIISNGSIVEIGPRLSVETPSSSNAVAMCHAICLRNIRRIERSRRYEVSGSSGRSEVIATHLDKMTQVVYQDGVISFDQSIQPDPVSFVPILERGEEALREVNQSLGLGMDEWDIGFYTRMFRDRYRRNSTNVEIFQIGNANSEHSRHWFFRGKQVIDGVEMPESLIDIIRAPLLALNSTHSVLAFNDNAGAIRGDRIEAFTPKNPGRPSQFTTQRSLWHITCTAETHNHPTLVAPYPGAETGSGGRIRDNTAPGRGALPVAGLAGYCVGNLFLDGYEIPGETVGGETVSQHASPSKILIEGSNGVSDYGNRFGEPLIGGFTRTFGQVVGNERQEFRKPVLYSGGVGRIQDSHSQKQKPEVGMLIIRIGGPAYRIGVGGGSASSMMQGTNNEALDFNSVQRGNAEMENRANRAIRACIEMGENNPIESIHDQGAGGPSNVLTELLEPVGGKIDIRKITLGDQTMSVLEIWSAEYQEGYGLLIKKPRLDEFLEICERERVNCEVVGEITGDGHVTVIDSQDGTTPVHLNLENILTGIPQKTFESSRLPAKLRPLVIPEGLLLEDAIQMVLYLPQVGSKGFLVHKVDRSVTGLVAQQQCCGRAQLPVADVSVTADGYFDLTGAATAIGEQPIKMLVNPQAGARMAVGEMLTNMVSARIRGLNTIRCRVNWMWPAKLPGEGARLYDAAVAMRDFMIAVGIAPDGGKDSLSMAATVEGQLVKSPGELVILGYAPVPDIYKVVTPDFKQPGKSLIGFIDLGAGKNRLGGSSLAQALGQIGDASPDVDDLSLLVNTFLAIQEMIDEGLILSIHDRSDGGLITSLIEMSLSGDCGASIFLSSNSDVIPALFSEELGIAFEYLPESESRIRAILRAHETTFVCIGKTTWKQDFTIQRDGSPEFLFDASLSALLAWWEKTSSRLETLQTDSTALRVAASPEVRLRGPNYELQFKPRPTSPSVITSKGNPVIAVLREEGTNGDREMAAAFYAAGLDPWDITMSDLLAGRITLDQFRGLVFPGGFSFMDVMGSGKGWAGVIRFNSKLREMFEDFYNRDDTFSLGVCNGCQLMALLGWVPWRDIPEASQPRFVSNTSGRFESRWAAVRINESPSILFDGMAGSTLGIWVAHGEGRLIFPDPSLLSAVRSKSLAPLEYVDPRGNPTEEYPLNPNGSPLGITALCSPDGRHLAMMPHPERCFLKWQWPWMPESWKDNIQVSPWLTMFQNARKWCLDE